MSTMITITCANCGCEKEIDRSEYNYQVARGRENFFCCRSCSAQFNNRKNRRWFKRNQVCEYCHRTFETESPYEVKFCSRECASAGSITEYRRKRMTDGGYTSQRLHPVGAESVRNLLKVREAWKYEDIRSYLDKLNIKYEFEYLVGKYVFDLALFDYNLFIEFDGDYHTNLHQHEYDKLKEAAANEIGWSVIRISTDNNVVLSPSLIELTISDLLTN